MRAAQVGRGLALVVALVVAVPSAGAAQEPPPPSPTEAPADAAAAPDRVLAAGDPEVLADQPGVTAVSEVVPGVYSARVGRGQRDAVLDRLGQVAGVEWAEPSPLMHVAEKPNDVCYRTGCGTRQSYLDKIRAPAAWDVSHGAGVTVAVIDTGIDGTHADLAAKVTTRAGCGLSPGDLNGHGTAVAGVVGAATDNTFGVAGVGWDTRLLAVRVLNASGSGPTDEVARGIRCAADAGARVLNLSLTGPPSSTLRAAVRYAQARGALLVAAAGNEGRATERYPAAYPGVLAVGATTSSDALAGFSNRGEWVDLAAPGVNIMSTRLAGGYDDVSGTSFAAPQVSGVAALLIAKRSGIIPEEVVARINRTAAQIPESGRGIQSGRLDAGRALTAKRGGYRMVSRAGDVYTFGDAAFLGSLTGQRLARPIVGMAGTPDGKGYWLVASDGGVFAYGNARFHGSTGGMRLNRPIVGMAPTPSGKGYWLVASDGGLFAFGNAGFHGSTGGMRLNRPIVGMAPTRSGGGYWLVASDGGLFAFDAPFYGSTGHLTLTRPVVGMARTPSGKGYWLVASDGGLFAFGNAGFHGSTGGRRLARPIVGMATPRTGGGYWLVASDGGLFSFGQTTYFGSTGGRAIPSPIVSMAVL